MARLQQVGRHGETEIAEADQTDLHAHGPPHRREGTVRRAAADDSV
jgi:hypothetical protein